MLMEIRADVGGEMVERDLFEIVANAWVAEDLRGQLVAIHSLRGGTKLHALY